MQSDVTLTDLVNKIITNVLSPIIVLLFGIAMVILLWGIIQYVIGAQGDSSKLKQGRNVIIYGIIGIAIMASAWGLVRMICNFFETCSGGGGINYSAPATNSSSRSVGSNPCYEPSGDPNVPC